MQNNTKNLERILHRLVARATELGADHAVAIGEYTEKSSLRYALNQATQHIDNISTSIHLAVAVNRQEAMVESNCLSEECIDAFIRQAIDSARLMPENPEFVPPLPPQNYTPRNVWHSSTAKVSATTRGKLVKDICRLAGSRNVDIFGSLNTENGLIAISNSSGLETSQPFTKCSLYVTSRTRTGQGSGNATASEADWNLLDAESTVLSAIETSLAARNPKAFEPGRYTVVLAPEAALEFIMYVLFFIDSREAELGHTFFSDRSKKGATKLGQRLFAPEVTLQSLADHPRLPELSFGTTFGSGGSQAGAIFSFGLPLVNHTWVENGVLTELLDSPYWALKNHRPLTGCPFNIVMKGTETTKDELIRSVKKGIYISSFWYSSPTDPNEIMVTGLTRNGVFLIEDGRATQPLFNFRFNDSPVRALNNILGLSQAEKTENEFITGLLPYIAIADFNLSSLSEAY